ncbi:helix-turn-helix domain-containing protein [Conexibacter sp. CPCC 206217]|uniref:winged helix-turn-helix transcriptional regulator n=1 Tax=Conexibacter sp. CPCC 206217 TaxID=3064574 RepID=UPI002727EE8B|nr:helix-turn-helix domain-containing protein [Conexibacter sp. CPCC 206217]MDO8212393.1 helix-turn-helix domain-containing protein [Conexibacter sp. CPCC 206217]
MLGKTYDGQDCGLARALEVVGERWTLLIVRDAFYGVERFGDFAARLDIPRAVLSQRLRSLVDEGLMERLDDPGHAGRPRYRLTADGRALWPALHALMRWGADRAGDGGPARSHRHARCGSELQPGGACPACGLVPPPQDVETERTDPARGRDDLVSRALSAPRRLLQPLELGAPST